MLLRRRAGFLANLHVRFHNFNPTWKKEARPRQQNYIIINIIDRIIMAVRTKLICYLSFLELCKFALNLFFIKYIGKHTFFLARSFLRKFREKNHGRQSGWWISQSIVNNRACNKVLLVAFELLNKILATMSNERDSM